MKDERGLYYYPSMQTHDVRMYVRRSEEGCIEFRMWNRELPEVWERHEWIPLDVVRTAARMYASRNTDRNPMALYDEAIATRLLDEDGV